MEKWMEMPLFLKKNVTSFLSCTSVTDVEFIHFKRVHFNMTKRPEVVD